MKEKEVLNKILLKLPAFARMFRNNVGVGWVGKVVSSQRTGDSARVTIENARPLHSGLIPGSSDLIGWSSIEITPEMVGKKVAIFTAIEVKADKSRPKQNQINFITQVQNAGGIAGIANVPEDALELLKNYLG